MPININRKLPYRPEPEMRFSVRGSGHQFRVYDEKWEMYLTTDDVSLTPHEAEELCRVLNNRDQVVNVSEAKG